MLMSWLSKRTTRKSRPLTRARLELTPLEVRAVPASLYTVQWLGTVSPTDNFSSAQGINDKGQVVGNSWAQDSAGIPAQEKAFSWTASGGTVDLGTLNGNASYAWSVNNNGLVTGWYHFPVSAPGTTAGGGYYEWAALWNNGVASTIPGYAQIGLHSVAYGSNDNGLVVGHAPVPNGAGRSEAFVFDGSTVKFLGTLGGQWSYGMDINSKGQVAGFADTGENPSTQPGVYVSRYHAVIWSPTGVIQDLGTFGTDSYAYKINEAGLAVGSSIGTDGFYHPFLWDGSKMIDIVGLGGNGEALSINNAGQVVGDSGNWLNSTAFLYEGGTTFDLNTLVPGLASQAGDSLARATDINNLGQIVGYGLHNGQYQAFVLTPGATTAPVNAAPTAVVGGPYTMVEGQSVTFDASASSDPDGDPLTFVWSANGNVANVTSATPTLTWADLQALGVTAGSSFAVSVQVNDGQGHSVSASTTLTVDVAPPTPTTPSTPSSTPTDGVSVTPGQQETPGGKEQDHEDSSDHNESHTDNRSVASITPASKRSEENDQHRSGKNRDREDESAEQQERDWLSELATELVNPRASEGWN